MTLTRWNPNRSYAMFRNMDRMFDEFFGRAARTAIEEDGYHYALPLDVYETGDDLVIKAHLPGVDAKQVTISVEQGQLTISAHIPGDVEKEEAKDYRWHSRETWFGDVTRSFTLPSRVDADKATADFKDGVLTLTLPKAAESKPRQIPVHTSK